ncbi:hypothetical protein ACO22_01084 [Paracoccidioides brasiliensis]|uniref:Uncharacterized protein n=1 Tax=Paracoccidioides brasiliensis TaxID=121759 RepID=A0A1D2JMS5_PARBR|nr:hypothetical protein ACO22_01084 [Paracoccidioides brasiliensis]
MNPVNMQPTNFHQTSSASGCTLSYLPEDYVNIPKIALDVSSPGSVNEAFAAAAKRFGSGDDKSSTFHHDVVVNCAGYSLSLRGYEAGMEKESHAEIETLFFGTARMENEGH